MFGSSILEWSCLRHAFELLAEAGDVAVAGAFGDAGDGELGGAEEFGGFFEAESLQVGLEAEAVVLSEQARDCLDL